MDDDELIAGLAGGDDRASTWAGATRGPGPSAPLADRGAWTCALLVFAAGLAAVTSRGARISLAGNG